VGEQQKKLDRELIELLNELRVALPGVQVLFAFLLTVPFSQRFTTITPTQVRVYFASVLATAAATAFLIAPTAYHRLHFRERSKDEMMVTSNRLALAGTVFLATAVALVVYLITDVLFGGTWTAVVTVAVVIMFGWLWYGLPLMRRLR
jgi:hypothetical protein